MERTLTRLSFIVLEDIPAEGDSRYVLQWNHHLDGYSFFGGHIDGNETPKEAAVRELKEETGAQELAQRWGVDLADSVPEEEWQRVADTLEAIEGPVDGACRLPFRSLRAEREGLPPEKTAEIWLFRLRIDPGRFPRLCERIELLTKTAATYTDSSFEGEICCSDSRTEFVRRAWDNPNNPFLRFAVKQGVVPMTTEERLSPPYSINIPALESSLQARLEELFAKALNLGTGEALDVRIVAPGADEARFCIDANRTLKARLEIRWTGSDEFFRISFPYPEAGVFIVHSDNTHSAGSWVWHPRLVSRPGLWLIRRHKIRKGEREEIDYLHLAFPGGRYLDIPVEKESRKNFLKKWEEKTPLPAFSLLPRALGISEDGLSDLLRDIEAPFTSGYISDAGRSRKQRNQLLKALDTAAEKISRENHHALDDQDLGYQRLHTYSVWLGERFLGMLARRLTNCAEGDPGEVWSDLCGAAPTYERSLVPVSRLQRSGRLHQFDPINGIEALSRLMSFQRYSAGKEALEHFPAVRRQNHPSFRGIVCPVDSPESKKVGITLHLARGVRTDVLGKLIPAPETVPDCDLGYAASLVPFYQHNDGARAMMGGKNLKQAVPVRGFTKPVVSTGHEEEVEKLVRPLVDTGVNSSCRHGAPGVDLLVAYMPWFGWNYEDAIVANRRLVDEGVLDWVKEESYSHYILPGYELDEPEAENAIQAALLGIQFGENGLRRLGEIQPDTAIAFFRDPQTGERYPVRCGGKEAGELMEISYSRPPSPLVGGMLSWKVRRQSPLMVGDKLMGRYGNKGVVSILLPPEELPRLPDDPRLPENLRGRAVDLVLNPHGVISRMNLGQLLESHVGLAHCLGVGAESLPDDLGRAFVEVDLEAVRASLLSINGDREPLIDDYGRMFLSLPGGDLTRRPVTVGIQHIVRLRHVAEEKAQVRPAPSPDSKQLYTLITGQPAGGRSRNGGQRIGEMEVWALAAHQAGKNLESILNQKSDPLQDTDRASGEAGRGQTFRAIRDHFFAMGIALEDNEDSLRLDWATPGEIKARGQRVTSSAVWTTAVEGRFRCSAKSCNYHYPGTVTASGKTQRGASLRLTVRDVLADQGYCMPGALDEVIPQPEEGGVLTKTFDIELLPTDPSKKKQILKLRCSRKKELAVKFSLGKKEFFAYKQVSGDVKLADVADMGITCPGHTTTFLSCESEKIVLHPVEGGLCDPKLFGTPALDATEGGAWGYIELPFAVDYPRDAKVIRVGKEDDPPELTCVPVLPLRYRYRQPGRRGVDVIPAREEMTERYAKLVEIIASKESDEVKKAQLGKVLLNIFQEIHQRLFGKLGLIRRSGLGRRVDASGRLVIVPDPNLKWDECGVPVRILMTLLGDRIAQWPGLSDGLFPNAVIDRLIIELFGETIPLPQVSDEVRAAVLSETFWTDQALFGGKLGRECLDLAKAVIERYLNEHPDIHLILNRQPSLHRYSMMAFRPVPLMAEEGLALKINPLVCKGFAADFDGDEMAIHMPLSDEEHREAEGLNPTKPWNLISVADKSPLAAFDQDFVLGHFLISRNPSLREHLADLFDIDACDTCRQYFQDKAPWGKKKGAELLRHICESHDDKAATIVPEWMRLAFETVTVEGISFGFLELDEIRRGLEALSGTISGEAKVSSDENLLQETTQKLGSETVKYLQQLEDRGCKESDAVGYGFAALAVSGARGTNQARQLVTARGHLAPGDSGFVQAASRFFIEESLVAGMEPEPSFWAAMNTRSSMIDKKLGTPKAGDLTRKLVLVGWPWYVMSGDCGAEESPRRLTSCRWVSRKSICAACYGSVDGYEVLPEGYPAGLIAAQSFGERGTQLSMQSFHTGKRQLSMDEVVALLNGNDPAGSGYNWFVEESDDQRFIERIREEAAYEKIDERHLQLIWLMIHQSDKKSLTDAWDSNRTTLSSLMGPGQWRAVLDGIRQGGHDNGTSPFVKLLLNKAPVFWAHATKEVRHVSKSG